MYLQEPWKADNAHEVLGRAYPERIVDHQKAAKEARAKIWAVRGGEGVRKEAGAIQDKHGSRKSGIPNRGQRPPRKTAQLDLPLGD